METTLYCLIFSDGSHGAYTYDRDSLEENRKFFNARVQTIIIRDGKTIRSYIN